LAQLASKFDATAHDTTQTEYADLPEGIYSLEVIQSEVVATSKGDGTMLKLRYSVIEPEEYKGRLIFGNINLENPNSIAQEVGQKFLASLCRAIGLSEIEDSDELHLREFRAKVGLGKPSKDKNPDGTPKYPARVEIRKLYFPDADDMPEIGITAPTAATPKPANDNRPASGAARTTGNGGAAATKSRPWGKRAA
jgi:hypothetical protein